MAFSVRDGGGTLGCIGWTVAAFALHNIAEYYWHRMMHHRWFYTRMHKIHHHYKSPEVTGPHPTPSVCPCLQSFSLGMNRALLCSVLDRREGCASTSCTVPVPFLAFARYLTCACPPPGSRSTICTSTPWRQQATT